MPLASQISALATRVSNYLRDSVLPRLVPAGGVKDAYLVKSSATDYALSWSRAASFSSLAVDARPSWAGLTPWDSGNFNPANYLPVAGGSIATGTLSFGATIRQMINLWNTSYAIGVQDSAAYIRTASEFAVHSGGSHVSTQGDPGSGGTNLLRVATGYFSYKGQSVWHSGNFNPGSYAAINGNPTFNTVSITENGTGSSLKLGDDAVMGDVNVANTIGIRGTSAPATGYFQFGNGGSKFGYDGGNWTMAGGSNLFIQPGGGGNYSVYHTGNFNPANYVSKSGDTMTGSLNIDYNYPQLQLTNRDSNGFGYIDFCHVPYGHNDYTWRLRHDPSLNEMKFCYVDDSNTRFSIRTDGSVWTKQFGDLNSRIEDRSLAWAREIANRISGRLVHAGDLNSTWNANANNFAEPYGGGIMTVTNFIDSGNNYGSHVGGARWRYLQLKNIDNNWVTVGYA